MEPFLIALIITLCFLVIKIIERRFTSDKNEPSPIRSIIIDTILVYVCSVGGLYIVQKYEGLYKTISGGDPEVFTDNPF